MPRILAIDYGARRTGLAWTDPMQIIATGVGTVDTARLHETLARYVATEDIEAFVLGFPTRLDGSDTHVTQDVRDLAAHLQQQYPGRPVHLWDERFSSAQAMRAMIDSGVKQKQRRDKQLINEVSAVLILQGFMEQRG
ncbi:MAG: Holliday junction resolvase RuvX [Bacteroidia bacterium]